MYVIKNPIIPARSVDPVKRLITANYEAEFEYLRSEILEICACALN